MRGFLVLARGSSPHTRGARFFRGVLFDASGIIPAYAGSTSRTRTMVRCHTDHPRIRGEHSSFRIGSGAFPGSSPHTRGAHLYRYGPYKGT